LWTPAGVKLEIWAELSTMPAGVGGDADDAGEVDVELHDEEVLGVAGGVSYDDDDGDEMVEDVEEARGGGGGGGVVVVVGRERNRVLRRRDGGGGAGMYGCSGDRSGRSRCGWWWWHHTFGRGWVSLAK
jgi:hypothetical protein